MRSTVSWLAGACLLWLSGCASVSLHEPARVPVHDASSNPVAAPAPQTAPSATPVATSSHRALATPAPRQPNRPAASTEAPAPAVEPLSAIDTASPSVPQVASLTPPTDLWDRIRRGFAMPDLDTDGVRGREQWYATRPDYLQRMTERSRRYLFHIVEEVEMRNIPMELALLPFIESAFNPQAVSSARAAGIWQFMPATGESFDLKQNMFRDDRRDVLASTNAALDYLQQLYSRFGDWHLALAAYNWGQGNVNRAITNNRRNNLPTGYTDLKMPPETRDYVPKLQAVKNIIARPEAFGVQLPEIGNHPFFETVTLDRDMDVSLIARLSGISEQDFRILNPSQKKPLVMAAGSPNILLPWDQAAVFQRELQNHRGPLASWTAWQVPSTMTPEQAAERLGMDVRELREVNSIPPRMLVRAGSTLLVPRQGQLNRDVSVHLADNGQLSLQPEMVLRRVWVRARKGENVAQLAQRYKLSPAQVAQWNKLPAQASLKANQRVALMLPQPAARAQAKAPVRKTATVVARAKGNPKAKAHQAAKPTPKIKVAASNK
ncbi:MAG: hypothetical protein RLZZ352_1404 [Pseudomonadota bacterium]